MKQTSSDANTSRFRKSVEFLKRAEEVIPLGSQTFSKSKAQYPVGFAPLYATHAKGALLWDVDGNEYIDLVNNLASVTLGYSHAGQNRAVRKQLKKSVGMSLPSTLEAVVAEKIIELVPSAEMVRFAKNGSDATSAAIRLSRAYTSRDHIAVCGYHGWQDWYIGSTNMNLGVPNLIRGFTHTFTYNNLESLKDLFERFPQQIACVILEPMNREDPADGFLDKVLKLCEREGAVCIFDETITGFRLSEGGAQKLFGVTPHLSTFGKGIANGFPLSVVCGSREIMREMENVFFSGTFGGELMSLAAADYVLDQHLENRIVPVLLKQGQTLRTAQEEAVLSYGLQDILNFTGHPSWLFYNWADGDEYSGGELRAYFMQEIFKLGILLIGSNNISLAHDHKLVKQISDRFQRAVESLSEAIIGRNLKANLGYEPQHPVLKIR